MLGNQLQVQLRVRGKPYANQCKPRWGPRWGREVCGGLPTTIASTLAAHRARNIGGKQDFSCAWYVKDAMGHREPVNMLLHSRAFKLGSLKSVNDKLLGAEV
jgi:hypothetical protein